ncbi:MAG: tRNA (adenosine(37)-N6)-threonylcarbamoyltransferase complex dimerization subunit type 1 TsaB [Candidatus Saccharimonadales bacterium]
MYILTIRTDKPEAEIGLFEGEAKLAYSTWHAHRQLAETIHLKIRELLESQGRDLHDIEAVVAYKGPGSFTGLRIGLSVANVLAYSLDIPIVATNGLKWTESGIEKILDKQNDTISLPEYGAPAHTTEQKK